MEWAPFYDALRPNGNTRLDARRLRAAEISISRPISTTSSQVRRGYSLMGAVGGRSR
jgi:NADH/NAD ratio-sensing transcriptional regulator Rex